MTTRCDPIREKYYKPLEKSEKFSTFVFYLSAIFSFSPLLIDKKEFPEILEISIAIFVISVIAYAIAGLASRLYFFPRAEDARRKEFLSSAMGIELIHERTSGYYNNDKEEQFQRLGMMLFENTFFTMRILQAMAFELRCKTLIYAVLWIFILVWRGNSLDLISAITIVIFGEEIFSRFFRFEWQRMKVENIYENMRRSIQSNPIDLQYKTYILDELIAYERSKAVGGILLSEKKFNEMNEKLSQDWERIKISFN